MRLLAVGPWVVPRILLLGRALPALTARPLRLRARSRHLIRVQARGQALRAVP